MAALSKTIAESYAEVAQPSVKEADLIRFPQNEIIRRRQYAEQMKQWLAWKANQPEQTTGHALPKMQHQPR